MPAEIDLTDLSLLIFADVATTGKRTQQRLNTLCAAQQGLCVTRPPKALQALERAGLIEIRRTTPGRGRKDAEHTGYKFDITDKGLSLHRRLMAALRHAATHIITE